jgi:osmotically-inducible protein OsmY
LEFPLRVDAPEEAIMITAALHQSLAGPHCTACAESTPEPRGSLTVAPLRPGETDYEIAVAARRALAMKRGIPRERIQVDVRDGRITLEGEVEWLYQCFDAYDAVCHLKAAAGCTNHIRVVAHATS